MNQHEGETVIGLMAFIWYLAGLDSLNIQQTHSHLALPLSQSQCASVVFPP